MGASTAASSSALDSTRPMTPNASAATAAMKTGIPMTSSRHVVRHALNDSGRSRARPTPMIATMTETSVSRSTSSPVGDRVDLGQRQRQQADEDADRREPHGHGDGAPAQQARQDGGDEQADPADDVDDVGAGDLRTGELGGHEREQEHPRRIAGLGPDRARAFTVAG